MSTALRVKPQVWIGAVVWAGYVVLMLLLQKLGDVPYPDLDKSGSNLFFGVGISLIVATVVIACVTTGLGWWGPVLREPMNSRHRWPIIVPILTAALSLANLAITDWSSYDLAFLGASIVLLLVGFTEEMTTRGLLLVGLRSRVGEMWVWLFTSLAFALMHLINALAGQSFAATAEQVVVTFFAGTIFYICRRVTGRLVWSMVLHGLWDFATFAAGHGGRAPIGALVNLLYLLVCVIGLVAVWSTFSNHVTAADTDMTTSA